MADEREFVSVVMPVRNAMPFLDEAVASILAQSHSAFEFVIGDDGSTDGSSECLQRWAARDGRIRLLRNDGVGLGPSGSSNWVAREARHPLVARMDADDISMPDRLRRHVAALRADPGAVLVCSLFECIDASGRVVGPRDRSQLIKPNSTLPTAHGVIMFRRDVFDRIGGYRRECDYWEDLDIFIRLGWEGRVLVLPDVHYRYRYSPTSARAVTQERKIACALDVGMRCMAAHRAGLDYDPILRAAAQAPAAGKVSTAVMVPAALQRLWTGAHRSIIGWTLRNVALGWNRASAVVLLLACWAWISPASLRAFMRLHMVRADRRAGKRIVDGRVYCWQTRRPGEPPLPAELRTVEAQLPAAPAPLPRVPASQAPAAGRSWSPPPPGAADLAEPAAMLRAGGRARD
jgi:glycosyl transferase family 2